MKRRNYASKEMIAMVATLREKGIKEYICSTSYVTKTGKVKTLKHVWKSTAQGISAYANNMFLKYGDSVCVVVTYFDNDMKFHILCEYGA